MSALIVVASCFLGELGAQDPILAKLSAETTNVIVVRDPLPLLEQVLDSPITQRLLEGTADLSRASFGRELTAAALKQQLALVRAMIPVEVVIAAPTRTMDRLSHAAPLFACYTALQMIGRSGPTDGALASAIRVTAKHCLEQFDNMPLQAWVKARDERTADQWFESLGESLRANARMAGLDVKIEGERIEVRVEPFAAGAPLIRLLEGGGIDASTAPVLEVLATIELRGTELELRLGKLAPPPCMAERLGTTWDPAPNTLLFARAEVGDAVASLTDAYLHVAALGELELAAGDAELMVRLVDFLGKADDVTTDQSCVLCVDRGLVWIHENHGAHVATNDAAVPADLLRLVSPDAGPVFATSDTLDVVLAEWFDIVTDESLPEGAPGRPLADFLDDEASAAFAPGVLVTARPAAMRGMKGGPAALPFAAVAMIARPKSSGDGAAFVAEMTKHIAAMLGGSADVWREQDLGLGTKTHALRLDVVAPLLQQRQIDWDFAPHWFVSGDLLVVSTDPNLSKELIARATAPVVAVPAKPRLQHFYLHGATIVDWAAGMKAWAPIVGELQRQPQDDRVRLFAALQAAGGAIEFFEMRAEVDGAVLRETTTLRLREPTSPK
jgi:hypothetical protein